MDNQNRLLSLRSAYKNKSLTREERKAAMNEYYREVYRRDPRKPISLGRQTLIDCAMSLIMGLNFLFMGTVENLGIKREYHNIISPIETVFILLMVASLLFNGFVHSKYKKEPDDELSAKHKLAAKSCGLICVYTVLFVIMIVYFAVMRHETFVITHEAAIFCFAGIMFMSKFIDGVVFLILEGRGSSKDDDEEEEE